MKIELETISVIHAPFMKPEGMPIQPDGADGIGPAEYFEVEEAARAAQKVDFSK